MRNAVAHGLVALAASDKRVMLLTGDLGYSVLERFAERFPDRFINVGVAEQNMVGVAAGLALTGHKVFCWSIVNFAVTRCLEQIRNDVAYHDADVTIIGIGGGLAYGTHGYTHHGIEDIAFTRVLPHMAVVVPSDPAEGSWALARLAERGGPAYLRLNRGGEPTLHKQPPSHDFGQLMDFADGADVQFLCCGPIAGEALAAAETLKEKGVSAGVTSVPVIQPIDREGIAAHARRARLIVTVEEHLTLAGLGGAVAELVAELEAPHARLIRLGLDHEHPGMVGTQDYLRARYGLDAAGLVARVQAALG